MLGFALSWLDASYGRDEMEMESRMGGSYLTELERRWAS